LIRGDEQEGCDHDKKAQGKLHVRGPKAPRKPGAQSQPRDGQKQQKKPQADAIPRRNQTRYALTPALSRRERGLSGSFQQVVRIGPRFGIRQSWRAEGNRPACYFLALSSRRFAISMTRGLAAASMS
jgi:hypothetical protein